MYANAFVQTPADMTPRRELETKEYPPGPGQEPLPARPRHPLRRPGEEEPPDPPPAQGAEIRGGHGPVQEERTCPLLYWTAVGWVAAFSVDPFDMTLGQTLPQTRAMIERVAELEPGYGRGALDAFYVSYYGSLPDYLGGDAAKAREHFAKAQAIAGKTDTSSLMALATTVSVKEQNAAEFKKLLGQVLEFDPDSSPSTRLVNILNQRKARWFLDHIDDFFIELEHP